MAFKFPSHAGGRGDPPFDALRTFVDPSVEFGLRFETHAEDEDDDEEEAEDEAEDDTPAKPHEAEIVSLDKFRK